MPADLDDGLRHAADILRRHPWVGTADVGDGTVRISPTPEALAVRPQPGALLAEHLAQWAEVYDATYAEAAGRHSTELDLSGWRASDTGQPLPVAHMREWVRRTAGLVLRADPHWVLELGCGTGLLMHRLRPRLRGYVGTDVSAESVGTLTATAPPGTTVVRAAAHEAHGPAVQRALAEAGFPEGRPDCVVLNSVTQCFPGVAYLRAVVHDAIALVAPGGTVVVGDIRHSGLLTAHWCWVESSANPGLPSAEVDRRAAERAARDEELLFDPPLLARIAGESGREVALTFHPKTLGADTELTRYRFDAVLRVDAGATGEPPATDELDWAELPAGDRRAALRELAGRRALRVTGIPNRLLTPGTGVSAAELRRTLADLDAAVLLDPRRPELLQAVTPADAAPRPAAALAGPGTAHEPLRRFVRRRLAEAARRELRRAGLASVPIDVAPTAPGNLDEH
ncbi:bifunctional 2-polyprenyl-6-hydroxyphenol methylase/3-demethylubiquinol 3-O-methyltransferase UbiG [Streptomyces sp. PT12]|uniref:class I SAM-dependent methyltransferase n=1 Tax=Streptomyces sp. PT12 TaxID=1510197 RepID=UPI000DE56166|nr:class I SAM-dependent methyltransferase [Streptomyces sp. PT12]RBM06852.1 methyltransferase type 12 [Streptomyces sp. PT12]